MRRSVLACGLFLLGACAALPRSRPLADYAWAAGTVRLELERIIAPRPPSTLRLWIGANDDEKPRLRRPYGVAWDGEELVIADPDANLVFRVSRNGTLRMSPPLQGPTGIAVCGGETVVTESRTGRVLALRRDLHIARVIADNMARPTGVACEAGTVYVVETGMHRLVAIDDRGGRRTIGAHGSAAGEFNFPAALAVTGGAAYVGDTLNFRVQRLVLGAGDPTLFGALGDGAGDTPRIKGIAVDGNGVWVSDAHLDQVSLFDGTGRLLAAIGGRGQQPGEFSFPAGLAVSVDGRLAVADSLNMRVQVFRIIGKAAR